jgi:metal-responsive CopG/Arc/MetJ family transcriptional regulator
VKEGLTEKVQIMVPPSLIQQIDDWRFANRVASRSRAMRSLMEIALSEKRATSETRT